MKMNWIAALAAAVATTSAVSAADNPPDLSSEKDKASYIIGVQTGRNFRKDNIEVDIDQMARGMRDGLAGTSRISEDETRKFMTAFMNELKRKSRVAAEDNRMKAAAFLQENKTHEGIVTLESGVQYKVLKAGDGKKPSAGDEVVVNYRGTLLDGTQFDKTDEGKPATIKLASVIPGWKEALTRMPVGSRWQLFIPPERAYGDHGAGMIGPNQLLEFEVELVAIK